jgi:hypothetical protein
MRKVINFEKDNCEVITLEELKETCSLSDYKGHKPKAKPLEHYELIETIITMLTINNLKFDMGDIYTSKSDTVRIMKLDPDKIGLLESWMFQRLVTKIDIHSNDANYTPSIGIGYNINGMTIAVGTNVRVCSNMSIFGNKLIQSYGNNAIHELDKFKELVNTWITNIPEIHKTNLAIFEGLKEVSIDPVIEMRNLIGDLEMDAVRAAYIDTKHPAALNIGQVSQLSKDIMLADLEGNKMFTAYELYNCCTSLLVPNRTDIANIWQDNATIGKYFCRRYLPELQTIE